MVMLVGSLISFSQPKELRLAADVWPPFTDVEGHQSISTDLVREALSRAGIASTIQLLEFTDVMTSIKAKEIDGSPALWSTSERKETLIFSVPYLQNRLVLVGLKGADVSARSLTDLAGKKVAVVGNYAYEISEDVANNLTFVYGKSDQENLTLLLKEEADYMLVDALIIQFLLSYQQEEVAKYLAIGSNALLNRTLHFAIRKDIDGAEGIIHEFNNQITKMVMDGSYNEILQLKWIQADVDGDGKTEYVLNGTNAGKQAPAEIYNLLLHSSNTSMMETSNQYYVDGKIYDDWNNVPNEYKSAPTGNMSNNVGLLSFRLNKQK